MISHKLMELKNNSVSLAECEQMGKDWCKENKANFIRIQIMSRSGGKFEMYVVFER